MSRAGFSVVGLQGRVPVLSFGPECTAGEPVLVYSDLQGNWTISTLDLFRDQAQRIYDNEITPGEAWRELYVILPGSSSILPCAPGFAGDSETPLLLIQGTASVSGVLWTCEL